ncbi:unnamed protein product, partial [Nesidiocoris tenuis]
MDQKSMMMDGNGLIIVDRTSSKIKDREPWIVDQGSWILRSVSVDHSFDLFKFRTIKILMKQSIIIQHETTVPTIGENVVADVEWLLLIGRKMEKTPEMDGQQRMQLSVALQNLQQIQKLFKAETFFSLILVLSGIKRTAQTFNDTTGRSLLDSAIESPPAGGMSRRWACPVRQNGTVEGWDGRRSRVEPFIVTSSKIKDREPWIVDQGSWILRSVSVDHSFDLFKFLYYYTACVKSSISMELCQNGATSIFDPLERLYPHVAAGPPRRSDRLYYGPFLPSNRLSSKEHLCVVGQNRPRIRIQHPRKPQKPISDILKRLHTHGLSTQGYELIFNPSPGSAVQFVQKIDRGPFIIENEGGLGKLWK